MIKILMLSSRSDRGGGPKHIAMLLELLGEDYECFVAAPQSGCCFNVFARHSSAIMDLPYRRFSLMAFIKLCRFASKHEIDIVHSHGRGAGYYARLMRMLSPPLKVVHTHHGFYYQRLRGAKRWILVAIEKALSKLTHAFIFVSKSESEMAASVSLFNVGKSYFIPNGVKLVSWVDRKHSACKAKLIAVTRLEREKGNDILIRVAAELVRLNKDFVLSVVGVGPDRVWLESLVAEFGLQAHVQFLGGRGDVSALLSRSDVFVSASFGEAHPLSVVEAMMHGVPVVVSRVLGHVDTIEAGRTGFMFEIDSPRTAAAHIANLMSDSALWQQLRRNAYEVAKAQFEVERMVAETRAVYRRVLAAEA